MTGAPRQAERALADLASRPAAALRARARFAAGDLRGAEAVARLLLANDDATDVAELELLAEIAWSERRLDEVRAYVRRALAVDPYDPEARGVLARLEQQSRRRPSEAHES